MDQRAAKHGFKELRARVLAILREEDPIGLIRLGSPPDEYDPEVGTLLPRLKECTSQADLRRILHEEFTRWFDSETAGTEDIYEVAATRIWTALREERDV